MGTWESAVTSRLMRLLVTALRREPGNAFPLSPQTWGKTFPVNEAE